MKKNEKYFDKCTELIDKMNDNIPTYLFNLLKHFTIAEIDRVRSA